MTPEQENAIALKFSHDFRDMDEYDAIRLAIRAAVAAERERCAKYHDALALSYHDTRILLLSRPNREEDASIAYRMAQCHEESAAAIRRGE